MNVRMIIFAAKTIVHVYGDVDFYYLYIYMYRLDNKFYI